MENLKRGLQLGKGIRPTRKHKKGSVRASLHKTKMKTLEVGDLYAAIRLPQGEDRNEWFAMNVIDSFNDISLLYGVVVEEATRKFKGVNEGFPSGYEYRWMDPPAVPKPKACSAPEYADYVITWVDAVLSNPKVFPTDEGAPFPADFSRHVKAVCKRMFRIFAIMYHGHWDFFEQLEMTTHVNTCFKRFLFFCLEFDLLGERELGALPTLVRRLRREFVALSGKDKARGE